MTITLYTMTDDLNVINKTKTVVGSALQGTLREATSLVNPIVKVTGITDIADVNYMYIEEFNRYYFVKDITFVRNGVYEISAHVDVLESFKDSFMELECILERSACLYNNKYPDPHTVATTPHRKYQYAFTQPTELANDQVVLLVIGKRDIASSNSGGSV